MTYEDILELVKIPISDVRKLLDEIVMEIEEPETRKWMEYFFESKGHGLRPVLTFLSYYSIRQNPNEQEYSNLLKMAGAFELLHSASLIHDDVIDEGDIRRGKATINKSFSSKAAILIGNIFYLEAFKLILTLPENVYFKEMMHVSENMCFGEIVQLSKVGVKLETEEYIKVIKRKTAELISMCMRAGARLAGADRADIDRMSENGLKFGIMYQLRDDIKDQDVNIKDKTEISSLIKKYYYNNEKDIKSCEENPYNEAIHALSEILKLFDNGY